MFVQSRFAILDWNTSPNALLGRLLPLAHRFPLHWDDSLEIILHRLPPEVKQVIFHVDLSLPGLYPVHRPTIISELRRRGIQVLNASITDVTKRNVQRCNSQLDLFASAVPISGDPDELIIIKTNYNSGGFPEQTAAAKRVLPLVKYPLPVIQSLASMAKCLALPEPIREYPLRRRDDIPVEVWISLDFALERYIENKSGLSFRIYVAQSAMIYSAQQSGKCTPEGGFAGFVTVQDVINNPERNENVELRALAAAARFATQFGLDYGALDVVVDEMANPYIVDVNPTPSWDPLFETQSLARQFAFALLGFHEKLDPD